MKITKTTIICDRCGAEPTIPSKEYEIEKSTYRFDFSVRDNTKCKGAYKPPFRKCHICADCREILAGVMARKKDDMKV